MCACRHMLVFHQVTMHAQLQTTSIWQETPAGTQYAGQDNMVMSKRKTVWLRRL